MVRIAATVWILGRDMPKFMKKLTAVFATTTLLLNAMAPTLAHAATYLQGAEVNANTLTQDAYVAVTYYDSNGEQKLEKGWIDTIGETSFTIRKGGFRGKRTTAYDKVVSVIMSDESTVPAKQMNEVNRFIRNMKAREIEQAKKWAKTRVEQPKGEAKAKFEAGEIDSSTVKPGAYVEIIYGRGERDLVSGEWERLDTARGYIQAIDAERLIIRERFWKKEIELERIQKLTIPDATHEMSNVSGIQDSSFGSRRLQTEIVLEAGEIDSSAVEVGAFVEVIYGKGKRDSVSGEWERLNNVKGYVKAVDAEHLIIGERFWKEQVVLDRIQKLIISDSAREVGRSGDEIGGTVATEYRNAWPFLGIAPGTVIFDEGDFSIVHVFTGFELGAGQFSASIEAGYGAPIEALQWGVGVLSMNGNFHLIKKHRLNTGVPFLSIGYTALVREGSTSLFNVGAGITWWSHKGRSLRLEVRDHITWSGGEGAHALEFRISAVR